MNCLRSLGRDELLVMGRVCWVLGSSNQYPSPVRVTSSAGSHWLADDWKGTMLTVVGEGQKAVNRGTRGGWKREPRRRRKLARIAPPLAKAAWLRGDTPPKRRCRPTANCKATHSHSVTGTGYGHCANRALFSKLLVIAAQVHVAHRRCRSPIEADK